MQPSALLRLDGHVMGTRTVEVPAREASERYPAREAFAYQEADIAAAVSGYDGELAEGVTAICQVTFDDGDGLSKAARGEFVSLYVRPYATFRTHRGRSFPVVALRFVAPVQAGALHSVSAG